MALIKSFEQENARDPAYPDDPYAHQRGYEEEPEPRTRSGRMVTVAAVLALAVVGTGAALAYQNLCWLSAQRLSRRSSRADNSATKVVPAQSDGGASKIPDRMPPGDGGEKLVSLDEAPVDVNSKLGRVARGIFAAEPEQQPTAGCERFSPPARRWRRPRTARCRTTSRARSGRSP